jgi:protein involved in polysaccharide export with SLBB domain
MRSRVHSLLGFALLFHAPLAAQELGYTVRPGDRVTVEVFTAAGEPVDVVSGERILDRNGDLFLPYVGTVHASGLDEISIRELLTEEYGRFYDDPVVSVDVQLRVNITGAVGRPGQYFLDPTATLVDAVAQAGGTGPELAVNTFQLPANPAQVRLVRDGQAYSVNLRPDDITPETAGMRVRSGDWIHVPPQDRSRIRDEITFWGSLVSFATSVAALIILTGR